MKLQRSLIFHQHFLSVEFSRVSHLVHLDETLDEFGLSLVFSECWIFQRFILSTFLMKLLRCLIFPQYFLSVEFSRGPHLVHFDETLEKSDLPSIFTKCAISQKSTLSTFPMKLLRSLDFHRYFPSVGIFQRSTLSTFTMRLLKSSDSHRVFLGVEFFRGLYLVLFDETVEKFDFSSIFFECGIF